MKAREFVNQVLPSAMEMVKARTKDLDCVVGLHLLGEHGGMWTLKIRHGNICVEEGLTDYWDCAISIPAEDYLALAAGSLSPYEAMARGKIGISGNPGLTAKLRFLFRM